MGRDNGDDRRDPTITFVTRYFHPEAAATANRFTELAEGLVRRGSDVLAVVGQPTYSASDRKRRKLQKRDQYQGISIRRVPATRLNENKGISKRMFNYLTFFISSLVYLLIDHRDDDIIILTTQPPFLPILGWVLNLFQDRPYLIIVSDFYPDMAAELGYLSSNGVVYRVWDQLNERTYTEAEEVVVLGENMHSHILEKYGDDCSISVIHNWENGEFITPKDKQENKFAKEHDLLDKLVLLYSGNLGLHHDLESVVDAAVKLQKENPDIEDRVKFLLIGEGAKKDPLERKVNEQNVDIVSFLPYQSKERLPESLTCGDVGLVTNKEAVEGLCVSGKFYTVLASGLAVLAIAKPSSEIGQIIEETDCGIRVEPDSPAEIVSAVKYWLENPTAVERMGKEARQLFDDRFSKSRAIDEYYGLITAIISKQSR